MHSDALRCGVGSSNGQPAQFTPPFACWTWLLFSCEWATEPISIALSAPGNGQPLICRVGSFELEGRSLVCINLISPGASRVSLPLVVGKQDSSEGISAGSIGAEHGRPSDQRREVFSDFERFVSFGLRMRRQDKWVRGFVHILRLMHLPDEAIIEASRYMHPNHSLIRNVIIQIYISVAATIIKNYSTIDNKKVSMLCRSAKILSITKFYSNGHFNKLHFQVVFRFTDYSIFIPNVQELKRRAWIIRQDLG